jgi:hypothetical protein
LLSLGSDSDGNDDEANDTDGFKIGCDTNDGSLFTLGKPGDMCDMQHLRQTSVAAVWTNTSGEMTLIFIVVQRGRLRRWVVVVVLVVVMVMVMIIVAVIVIVTVVMVLMMETVVAFVTTLVGCCDCRKLQLGDEFHDVVLGDSLFKGLLYGPDDHFILPPKHGHQHRIHKCFRSIAEHVPGMTKNVFKIIKYPLEIDWRLHARTHNSCCLIYNFMKGIDGFVADTRFSNHCTIQTEHKNISSLILLLFLLVLLHTRKEK